MLSGEFTNEQLRSVIEINVYQFSQRSAVCVNIVYFVQMR